MKKVFWGLVWKDEKTPLFHIKTPETNKDEFVMIPQNLDLKNLHERYCVGTVNLTTMKYLNCNKRVDENNCQCNHCKFLYEFYKCVRCHGENCKVNNVVSKDYCDSPHLVYIAYFPNNKLKVGTASVKRKDLRLLEQGAVYGMYIAETPNGKIARQIENEIMKNGVTGMVSVAYKVKNIRYNEDESQIKSLLYKKYYELLNLMSYEYKKYMITPEFKSFPSILEQQAKCHILDQNTSMIEREIEQIDGKFLFAIGKIIAIRTGNAISLIDTRRMDGFVYEFGEQVNYEFLEDGGGELGR